MKMTMPDFPDRRVIFDLENICICLLDEDSQVPPNWADWNPGCGPPQECRHSHLAHCIGGPGVGRLRLSKRSRCYWSSQGSSGMIISHFSAAVDPITSLLGKGRNLYDSWPGCIFSAAEIVLSHSLINLTKQFNQLLNPHLLLKQISEWVTAEVRSNMS